MTNKPPIWVFFTIALLGLWECATVVSFGFLSTPLVICDFICGAALVIISLYSRKKPTFIALWSMAFISICLMLIPLVFWAKTSGAYINNTLVGAFVFALAVIFFPPPGQVPDEEPTIPPGWSYNPSSWPQRMPIAFFAFVCWMISRYLASYQLGLIDTVWDPFFPGGTKGVLESDIAKAFPVSDAGLGAYAYTIEFLATLQGGKARWRTSPWGVLFFGISVIPMSLVSIFLIILQPLVVGSWCTLCIVTAIFMLLPIPMAIDEVIATIQYLRKSKEKPFLKLLFFGGHCPSATEDTRTPPNDASFYKIWKASLWGVTIPWNLVVIAMLGVYLMSFPSDVDPIVGALTVVISVVACSEFLRKWRYLNILLALILFIGSFFSLLHTIIGLAIGILSIRKGPIREKGVYGSNHSM